MRKMRSSWNTLPTASLIATLDARSVPIGFSRMMRQCSQARPAAARLRHVEP